MGQSGVWVGLFRRSPLAPTVFEVLPGARPRVRAWLATQRVATAWTRDPHAPALEAWALADGGVLAVARWARAEVPAAADALPSGLLVVGFGAFRLLTAVLGVPRPTRPLPGEPLSDLDALRRAHEAASACSPDEIEQAELLATCVDRPTLRWVAAALAAATASRPLAAGAAAARPTPGPAPRPSPRDRPPTTGTLAG
ncbi:hypothetical protein ACL02T_09350 [Pseudonocardia sp. RS010]|uniref:hypothetical protein n=1 Tax=Pseudonocardia sp. RS010 TaxID=3385979 RepID=UPI0039A0C2E6